MESIIEVQNIEKVFGGFKPIHALKGVSFAIRQGEIFGILGPNGAGKTTLIKILLGLVRPGNGKAFILGEPVQNHKLRSQVGYLPENHNYPRFLTGEQILNYFGSLSGMTKTKLRENRDRWISLVKMDQWRKIKMKKYSKGMLQRIGLAQALVHDPAILFLDEPTDGVDPMGRREIREILSRLRDQGKTILINSHLLSEVEMICDRVAILHKGELKSIGKVGELTREKGGYSVEFEGDVQAVQQILQGTAEVTVLNEHGILLDARDSRELNRVIDLLREHKINLLSVLPHKTSLEDYFIQVIQDEVQNE